MMDGSGIAFGAGKAGGAFDPLGFVMRPQVILRLFCWLFSVIVFGCISNKGWSEGDNGKQMCIFNRDGNACRIGNIVSLVGFLGALGLLVLEALFQQLSSLKIRRRAVAADLGFSAVWTALFAITFIYLAIAWGKSPYPKFGDGINNARAAVAFSFLAIPSWAGCAYFAWIRWKSGADMSQFASGYEAGQVPAEDPYAQEYAQDGTTIDPNAYGTAGYDANTAAANPFANTYQTSAY